MTCPRRVPHRYVYTVEEGIGSPFGARYRWVLGRGRRLDVALMGEAAALLTGRRDAAEMQPRWRRDGGEMEARWRRDHPAY